MHRVPIVLILTILYFWFFSEKNEADSSGVRPKKNALVCPQPGADPVIAMPRGVLTQRDTPTECRSGKQYRSLTIPYRVLLLFS